MKSSILWLALVGQFLCWSVVAAEPPVTVTILEPLEEGALIYAPMGALTEDDDPTGRLWFKLRIRNDGPAALTLTNIRVTLTGIDVSIPQDNIDFSAGQTRNVALGDDEIVTVPHPAAANVTIRLYFLRNATPKQIDSPLVPYTAPVEGGSYLFPADEGDIGPDEYFSGGDAHGPGSQFWAIDWNVYRIPGPGEPTSEPTTTRLGGDTKKKEDSLSWGVPLRAMADGVVLRTNLGWDDNLSNENRAIQKTAEFDVDDEAITDVKVTRVSDTRAASVVILHPSGDMKVTIWDTADSGRQITRRGFEVYSAEESITEVAVDELSSSRLVTAVRLANNTHRLIIWNIDDNGNPSPGPEEDDVAVSEVSVTKLSSEPNVETSRFATAVRTAAGSVRVAVWELDGDDILPVASASGGASSSINVTMLSASRFATSLRTGGILKVIVWGLENGAIDRKGEATADAITRVVATTSIDADNDGIDENKWVTAMRTNPDGVLKLIGWSASEDGETVTSELVTPTDQVIQDQALAISTAWKENAVTASIIPGGAFKINTWNYPDDVSVGYGAEGQNEAGPVTEVSIDETTLGAGDFEFFAGARTLEGTLKITTWRWAEGGGNTVVVLHGNCRVAYWHLQAGSVDPNVIKAGARVLAGQKIGRIGNSGQAGGPHCHLQCDRLSPDYDNADIDDLVAEEALPDPLITIGTRPIPFRSARAMHLSKIKPGGEAANAFSTMDGHGMYEYSLGIRPRLNTRYVNPSIIYQAPSGRKEPVPGFPVTGGPMPTPGLALGAAQSGTRLYIRGGNYNEALTFSTPMTVRRYDYYHDFGSVVIGQ